MRVGAPAASFYWIPDPVLTSWWTSYVQLRGRDCVVSLSGVREQPRYWLFFRADGNSGLIAGPCDWNGARDFAERWLFTHGATPA
jgi:hypothetical protein